MKKKAFKSEVDIRYEALDVRLERIKADMDARFEKFVDLLNQYKRQDRVETKVEEHGKYLEDLARWVKDKAMQQ